MAVCENKLVNLDATYSQTFIIVQCFYVYRIPGQKQFQETRRVPGLKI